MLFCHIFCLLIICLEMFFVFCVVVLFFFWFFVLLIFLFIHVIEFVSFPDSVYLFCSSILYLCERYCLVSWSNKY